MVSLENRSTRRTAVVLALAAPPVALPVAGRNYPNRRRAER
jgi:hypothetical protein